MGSCVKCGKETANSYDFHSAILENTVVTGVSYSGNTKTTSYRNTYGNFACYDDYLCTGCVYDTWYRFKMVAYAVVMTACSVFIAVMIALTFAGAISSPSSTTTLVVVAIVSVLMLAAAVVSWLWVVHMRKAIREDERITSDKWYISYDGMTKAIALRKKQEPNRHFFKPEEFAKLQPSNPFLK